MTLEEIRQSIDQIDQELVRLLETRLDLVAKVLAYKKKHRLPILDTNRELALLQQVIQWTENPAYQVPIRDTFEDILKHSRAYQAQTLTED